ncbi:hypothetical protein FOZ63_026069 [Perkinsus olseni]|uniref:Uncharacterized protein n=1 Tax=Perkinsus olseni TaxID=32597 RepID=A0A7J6PT36_PEROL|nr:hypothetical protein FOZ63_026069 [Perkinsus olseni]
MLSSLGLLRQPTVQGSSSVGLLPCGQQRWKIHLSKSVIWRFYNRLNVRRKYKTAIRRGRMTPPGGSRDGHLTKKAAHGLSSRLLL